VWGTFRAAVSSGSGSSWGGGGITPDASPKEIQIHHRAGASGYGGSSYIDSMLLREKDTRDSSDAIQPPYAAADSTRDQTLYYVQNWRADVVALLNTDGRAMEHVRYTAYGSPRRFLTSPIDIAYDNGDFLPPEGTPNVALPNAGVGEGDYNAFFRAYFPESGSPQLAADVANDDGSPLPPFGPANPNNGVTEGDYNLFFSIYFDGWVNEPADVLSTAAIGNTIGYAGYEHDPILLTPPALSATPGEGNAAYYHVRNRVYDANLGRWTRRDPLGYVDGMGLYQYCKSRAVVSTDPSGLACSIIVDCELLSQGEGSGTFWRCADCTYTCKEREGFRADINFCDPYFKCHDMPPVPLYIQKNTLVCSVFGIRNSCPKSFSTRLIIVGPNSGDDCRDTFKTPQTLDECLAGCASTYEAGERVCDQLEGPRQIACIAALDLWNAGCKTWCTSFYSRGARPTRLVTAITESAMRTAKGSKKSCSL